MTRTETAAPAPEAAAGIAPQIRRRLGHWRTDPLIRALGMLALSPRRLLWSVLAGAATLGSALALSALSAWLITRAWQMPPVLDLTVAVVAVRALGISRGVLRYLERLITHDTALRGTVHLRETLYLRLAEGDPAAAARLRRGDLYARTGADVDTVGEVVIRAVVPAAVAAVLAVAAVGLVGVLSPAAGAVLAGALLIAGVAAPLLSGRAAAAAEQAAVQTQADYADAALTVLDHADELAVAGRLTETLARADDRQRRYDGAVDRAARPAAWAQAAGPLSIGAAVLGALLVGITAYPHELTSPMALAIVVLVPLAAFEATAVLPEAAVQWVRARRAAARIIALTDAAAPATDRPRADVAGPDGPPDDQTPVADPTPDGPVRLRAAGLGWGWPGGPVLGPPLDIELEPGARVAISGPSGIGKTTLLMTLAGLLPARAGTVTVGGSPIGRWPADLLRTRIGFFGEDGHLFATTVLENLRVARGDLSADHARRVLADVGLGPWLAELPGGVDTVLVGGAEAVSGGQRRRLLLARALVSPAQVLLLDEPTEHLDDASGAALQRALLDPDSALVPREKTVLVVSHRLPAEVQDQARTITLA